MVEVYHGEDDLLVQADSTLFDPDDAISILFVARKAAGFLLLRPVALMSFLISLMNATSNSEVVKELGDLLLDPVSLNYPGRTRDYVARRAEAEAGEVKTTLERTLARIDGYLEKLHSVGILSALHPSEKQREAHHRYVSANMAESFKAAEARSILMSLVTKGVLLYGRKSISYVRNGDDEPQRIEFPLQTISSEVEMPRMHILDPFGLDYMGRVYRVEQWKQ
jgi:hypothetical protein